MRKTLFIKRIESLVLLGLLVFASGANANYRCQYNNGVIVEAAVCPVGTIALSNTGSSTIRFSDSLWENQRKAYSGATQLGQVVGHNLGNLSNGGQGSPSQQRSQVQLKLNQIKEIDALYNSGSISKAQADALKRSVLGN